MSDSGLHDSLPEHSNYGLLSVRPNYRQALAAIVPSLYLAYAVLIWPLLFAGSFAADEYAIVVAPPPQSILSTLVFPGLGALALVLFLTERERLAQVRLVPLAILLALWGYLGLSTSWALVPSASFKDFVVLTITLLGLGLSTMLVDSVERFLRPMFWVMAATMVVNLAVVLLTPAGPIGHEGIYIHKNDLGGVGAVGALFALYGFTLPNRLHRLVSLVALAAWLLILVESQSKTSLGLAIISPMIGAGVVFARHYLRIAVPVVLVIAIAVLLFVLSGGIPGFSQADLSELIGGDRTFTGRTELWNFIIRQLVDQPLTGFGFHSFWSTEVGTASPTVHAAEGFLQKAPSAHNGYLELLLWGGWIAIGLFAVLMLAVTHWISRLIDQDLAVGCMLATVIAFLCLHNLFESTWFASNSANAILFSMVVVAMITSRPARSPRRLVHLI